MHALHARGRVTSLASHSTSNLDLFRIHPCSNQGREDSFFEVDGQLFEGLGYTPSSRDIFWITQMGVEVR